MRKEPSIAQRAVAVCVRRDTRARGLSVRERKARGVGPPSDTERVDDDDARLVGGEARVVGELERAQRRVAAQQQREAVGAKPHLDEAQRREARFSVPLGARNTLILPPPHPSGIKGSGCHQHHHHPHQAGQPPATWGSRWGLFCWPWPRSPTAPRAPFFVAVFLSTLGALFAMFLCAVMPLKGPCVSPVSVWVVWDVCGAQKVQCGGPGSPFGPPSRLLRPYRGGEGGSEVLIGETTCGPGGPKLHRPSV